MNSDHKSSALPVEPAPGPPLELLAELLEDFSLAGMEILADRFERPEAQGWVNMKLAPRTGEDFPASDPLRGRDVIYGWIQGRALEAVAGHIRHFAGRADLAELTARLRELLGTLVQRVQATRRANGGHLFFFLDGSGRPFELDRSGKRTPVALQAGSPTNFSDLFGAKGLLAASAILGDAALAVEATDYLRLVTQEIFAHRFVTDQQALDPANPVRPIAGRHPLGPFMISLGAATVWLETATGAGGDPAEPLDLGMRLLAHIFHHHVQAPMDPPARPGVMTGDVWEFINGDNKPWHAGHTLPSDPGHALEMVGLAQKFLRAVRGSQVPLSPEQASTMQRADSLLPIVLEANFATGARFTDTLTDQPNDMARTLGGIVKLVDLRTRAALHTDMPWWSLPETMRAAMLTEETSGVPLVRAGCRVIWQACHEAFFGYYTVGAVRGLSVQALDAQMNVSKVIPATGDLDPGYHTGLSFLDCAAALRRLS